MIPFLNKNGTRRILSPRHFYPTMVSGTSYGRHLLSLVNHNKIMNKLRGSKSKYNTDEPHPIEIISPRDWQIKKGFEKLKKDLKV